MRTKIIALLLASAGLAVTVGACRMSGENQAEAGRRAARRASTWRRWTRA